MARHAQHVFCSTRVCVTRDLHHELLALLDGPTDADDVWLLGCYRAEVEALEHADTDEIAGEAATAYIRAKARTWIAAKLRADNTHAHTSRELLDVLSTAKGARRKPLVLPRRALRRKRA